MGIVAICVMDRHVRAHALTYKLFPDKLRQQIDPFILAQFNGESHDKLTGQSAVFRFLRILHSVPELCAILPFRRGTVWKKDMLPDKALLPGVIMLDTIVFVIDGGAAHIGRCRTSRAPGASADDLRFQMVNCQSFSPRFFFLFLFLFRQRESRAIILDSPCLCDKAAGCRFSQAKGTANRSLRAGNDDRDHSLVSIGWCSPQRAQSASQSARPDHREGCHRRACGPVVSKCALRVIKKAERPVSRNAPLALLKCLSQKQVQFIHRHVNGSRTVLLNQRAFLDQPPCSGFSLLLPIPHLRLLQPMLGLEQFLFVFCHN